MLTSNPCRAVLPSVMDVQGIAGNAVNVYKQTPKFANHKNNPRTAELELINMLQDSTHIRLWGTRIPCSLTSRPRPTSIDHAPAAPAVRGMLSPTVKFNK